jgi:adenine-specific DNA-methyltransferase
MACHARRSIYADESPGKKVQDVWMFKDPQYPDYPTEKNVDLLKLIVAAFFRRR